MQTKRQRRSHDNPPSCAVCLHGFAEKGERQPLMLQCGHLLCKSCVHAPSLTSCPLCRTPLSWPLSSIPPNYALIQTLGPAPGSGSMEEVLLHRWQLEAGARLLLCPEDLVLGDVIKQGTSGVLRKATLGREGKQVAAKVLKLPPIHNSDSPQLSALKAELTALLLNTESCHHVCRYLGFTVKGEDFCLVMPLYPNTLADLIQQQGGGGLPLSQALNIAQDIARGLEELHGQGVAVLDLKPQNVLITAQGMAVLCDFSLNALLSRTHGAIMATQAAGTINYMSPEQTEEDSRVSSKADVWAFACTLIHMVTGQVPMGGLNLVQIVRKICLCKQAASIPPGLPPQLKQLLDKCLRSDPATRPSAAEISQALRPSLQGLAGSSEAAHLSPAAGAAINPDLAAGAAIRIVLKSSDCTEMEFTVLLRTRFSKLFQAYAARTGKCLENLRFLYEGARVNSETTAFDLRMEDGCVLDVYPAQYGQVAWEAADTGAVPGPMPASEQLLLGSAPFTSPSPAEVEQLVLSARTPHLPSLLAPLPSQAGGTLKVLPDLLSACECTALISHMDSQFRFFCADNPGGDQLFGGQRGFAYKDFKLHVPRPTLDSLISSSASAAIESCGGELLSRLGIPRDATSLRFLLRRSTFTPNASPPERIPFHRDCSLVVVNVALNSNYQGGSLMFCVGNQVLCPPRPPGCGTAHDLTTVHGVSRLLSGVRYNLLAVLDSAQA